MVKLGAQTSLSRILLRYIVYTVLLSIFLAQSWIDPTGSILHNVIWGFFIWTVPQLVTYFFFRGRNFGFGKQWIIRGVAFAILLTIFLNQRWIDPDGSYMSNMVAGLTIYVASYFVAFASD